MKITHIELTIDAGCAEDAEVMNGSGGAILVDCDGWIEFDTEATAEQFAKKILSHIDERRKD